MPHTHTPEPETNEMHGEGVGITEEQKEALDELHKRKIDLADEVLVINQDGYIGSSTRSEVQYAAKTGKPIRWRWPDRVPEWENDKALP